MYTMNMNKQTLTERFEDYTEDTKQEKIWSDLNRRLSRHKITFVVK